FVGSTESLYEKDMDDIHVNESEVSYLLGCLHDMFPAVSLGIKDVVSSWAGIRPLIGEDGKSPAELSRQDEIFESDSGLITIDGGKLTGYRKMAERVLQYIKKKEGKTPAASQTDKVKLSGGKFDSSEALDDLAAQLQGLYAHLQLPDQTVTDYVFRYGSNTEKLLEIMSHADFVGL